MASITCAHVSKVLSDKSQVSAVQKDSHLYCNKLFSRRCTEVAYKACTTDTSILKVGDPFRVICSVLKLVQNKLTFWESPMT